MRLDASKLPNDTNLDFDLCIVGGGPAGLTIAREFLGSQVRVCVIEAGAESANARSLRDLQLEPAGSELEPQSLSRWRQLGGTAAIRTAQGSRAPVMRAPRLDPMDFEVRDWVPHSGWPFGFEHLVPFYKRAEALIGLEPQDAGSQPGNRMTGFELDAGHNPDAV